MIVFSEWGRGFLQMGDHVREGSHAMVPTAWVDEVAMGIDRLAPEARLGAPFAEEVQAFIAYAETTPNPRWLAWDQPPRDAASEGPPPWHDADGLLIGELVAHRFGFVAWTVDGDGGMVRCFVGDPDGLEEWQATYRVEVLHGTPAARWRADGWVPGMGSMWRP